MVSIPLLKDNHNHFYTYSGLNKALDLFHTKDKKQALDLLLNDKNEITIAKGWFDAYYTFTESDFNNNQAVIIINNSLHKYYFNNKAANLISQSFPEWVESNNDQLWVEKNLQQIISFISGFFKFNKNSLEKALKDSAEKGIYINSDMYISDSDLIDFTLNSGKHERIDLWTSPKLFPKLNLKQKDKVKGVKIFTDGALGAYTAAISGYKTNSNPILTYSDSQIMEALEVLLGLKTGLAIHCIGDKASEQVIKALEELKQFIGSQEIRIEHSQFITKDQAIRAKKLGIILSMQPNFNWDSVIYSDRLDKKHCEVNNPFRMLIDNAGFIPGQDLIFGSDGMPSGIEGCIQQSLFPPVPGQKLSLDEFVAGYCIDSKEPGYIQLEIDELKKKVVSEVILK